MEGLPLLFGCGFDLFARVFLSYGLSSFLCRDTARDEWSTIAPNALPSFLCRGFLRDGFGDTAPSETDAGFGDTAPSETDALLGGRSRFRLLFKLVCNLLEGGSMRPACLCQFESTGC